MSTPTLTKPATPRTPPEARPSRIRYAVAATILGLASMGAVALATIGRDSTSPAPRPASAAPQPMSSIEFPPGNETFPGCLNDIECYGEPSRLPPGYWDEPHTAPSD